MTGNRSAPALGLAAVLALAGCNGKGETQEVGSAPDTATVERQDLEVRAEAAGSIEPLRVVEVKSRVGGELKSISVETGDELKQGSLIAEIDPRDLRNALAQAQADLELANARLTSSAAQRRRAESLAKAGLLSAQDLEAVQLEETNSKAQLLKARTNLDLARERMGDVDIRAPITGTVIEKTVEQGQIIASASGNVSGGTTLVKMADLATVQARALVDEVDIGRIQPGQPAVVTVETYPGRNFRGTVTKVEPQAVVEQNVTMFPVLVRLDNPQGLLKPGMNAEVAVEIAERRNVVAVPNGAVVSMREAAAAGALLGLDEAKVRTELASLRQSRGQRGGQGQGAAGGSGGPRGGGGGGERFGGGDRSGGGPPEGGAVTAGARPGVVFVRGEKGPEMKVALLGLSDWDFTEVLRGVEPGAQVYLISVARLQQQQEQFTSRVRERAGGGMLGGVGQRGGGGAAGGGGPRAGGGGRP
ncbi:MAG TPA: efflux RND transporter periplasmic adaptor subunit [Thermoanaerobaculia bacterium]